jgi:hypothetical protein
VSGAAAAPPPWRVTDNGGIVDANGRTLAYLAGWLYFPRELDAGAAAAGPTSDCDESWRPIADKMAAAPEMEVALAELLQHHEEALRCLGASAAMLQSPVLQNARAALAKARPR